nr:KinB-signaling pathway activation protein [Anoxybacillus flavithermus]
MIEFWKGYWEVEVAQVNSRKWVQLFFSTLFVGGISTGIVGFAVKWNEYAHLFTSFEIKEILSVLVWLIGVGFIFSVISQMGFFAYLTIHRFGLGIFRSVGLWNAVQIVLIAFVLFDLVYFRYQLFAKEGESIVSYVLVALLIFLFGLVVAYVKMRETNKEAFVPALFFMVVVTVIEWFPVLRINEENWLYLMLFPLLICNAYQLLTLHRLLRK